MYVCVYVRTFMYACMYVCMYVIHTLPILAKSVEKL